MGKIKTNDEFLKEFHDLVGDEYEALDKYKLSTIPIKIKHNKCGHIYEVRVGNFLNGKRCQKCCGNKKKTTDQFKKEIHDKYNDEYLVLGDYINNHTKIKMIHMACGQTYHVVPASILLGTRCPYCTGKRMDTVQFKKILVKSTGDSYILLSEYKSTRDKVMLRHKVCGKNFEMKPNNFIQGNRCPFCNESKGEKSISTILDKRKIPYNSQFTFKECRSMKPLPFDFYINNKILLEYDGSFHFHDRRFGIEQLEKRQMRDVIKNRYCIENNIPLIRIPYWEFDNIKDILENVLKRYNLIDDTKLNYDKKVALKYLVDENWNHNEYIAKCPKNIIKGEK